MHPSVEALNQNLSANYGIILKTLDDLDDGAAMRRFSDNTNPANWCPSINEKVVSFP